MMTTMMMAGEWACGFEGGSFILLGTVEPCRICCANRRLVVAIFPYSRWPNCGRKLWTNSCKLSFSFLPLDSGQQFSVENGNCFFVCVQPWNLIFCAITEHGFCKICTEQFIVFFICTEQSWWVFFCLRVLICTEQFTVNFFLFEAFDLHRVNHSEFFWF